MHFTATAIACLLLLCSCTLGQELSLTDVDPILFGDVVGSWGGYLEVQFQCSSDFKTCAFQLDIAPDLTFNALIGNPCFFQAMYCTARGNVVNMTSDTITLDVNCPGCFCEGNTSLTVCWRYARAGMMKLNVAMHLPPVAQFPGCPAVLGTSCNPITREAVGVGNLECSEGNCVTCQKETTCNRRGYCGEDGSCVCYPGFLGDYCNISACPNMCNGRGVCDVTKTKLLLGMPIFDDSEPTGVCRCMSGWSGIECTAADVYTGRQALWQGLIFIGVVSSALTFVVLFKKFSRASRRVHRHARRQRRRHRIEIELDEFMNPM